MHTLDESANKSPLFISASEIASCRLAANEVEGVVREALNGIRTGVAFSGLKAEVRAPDGTYCQALPSLLLERQIACVKWISVPGSQNSRPISATIVLSTMADGKPIAFLDGALITSARTAAMSAVAAGALASPESARIGMIGAGAQAHCHVEALLVALPRLRRLTVYSRTDSSARKLAEFAEQKGLETYIAKTPREAVLDQEVVVTTIPANGMSEPMLDAGWLSPGAFVAMPDLGRGWRADTLQSIGIWATDNRNQMNAISAQKKSPVVGEYSYELPELASLEKPISLNRDTIRGFVFGGLGVCDAAVAAVYLERVIKFRLKRHDYSGP